MDILYTQNLKKYYGKGENLVKALDGVTLSVEEGSYAAVQSPYPKEGTCHAGCAGNDQTAGREYAFI